MEFLLEQDGAVPESDHAKLERAVEEQKTMMASLQARGLPVGSYEKLRGTAEKAGQSYEHKMSTLLFVRGIKSGRNFSLMANMKAADKHGDVVFVDNDGKTCFIQLVHKKHNIASDDPPNQGGGNTKQNPFVVTSKHLTAPDGDFSLSKYLDSYRKIKRDQMAGDADLQKCGDLKNMRFLLFTNAIIDTEDVRRTETGDLFGTKGKYFLLNNNESISGKLEEQDDGITNIRDALDQLTRDIKQNPSENGKESVVQRIKQIRDTLKENQTPIKINLMIRKLVGNPTKVELEKVLKSDIFQLNRTPESRSEFLERFLLCTDQPHESQLDDIIQKEIHSFWPVDTPELSSVYTSLIDSVKDWSENENVILTATSRIWTEALHRTRRDKLASCEVTFTKEAVKSIVSKAMNTQAAGVRLITVDQPALATMKLFQQSEEVLGECMKLPTFVTSEVLLRQKDSVLSAWKSVWCNTLVVECEKFVGIEQARTLVKTLLTTAESENQDKTTLADQDSSRTRKVLVLVSKRYNNMVKVVKQSTNDYVEVDCKFTWNDLTTESQNHLKTKSVCFQGIYITLAELLQDKEALALKLDGGSVWQLLTKGTVQLGKRLEDPICLNISRSLITNQDVTGPVRTLADLPGNVALITGQPGMGKSTLFTELAHSTKQSDWQLWIIRLNLLDCSKYFRKIKSEKTSIDAIAFLHYFAGNGDTITSFEKALFTESLNKKLPKLAVLLDGVDEISPHYEKEVMDIIEQLLTEQQLHTLCVSCRSATKDKVESKLHVKASELVPFVIKEQITYLAAYWRNKNEDISLDDFNHIADKCLSLADESISGTLITGIPLMVELMAKIYNIDVLDFAKCEKKIPKTLYGGRLYNAFVERKFDIFLEEKKKVNQYISANISKRDDDFKVFKRQHMHAALMFLEPCEYELITQPNRNAIEKGQMQFLESIRNGVEKTGIIDGMTPSGQPGFIHRTFMEYFQATWIYDNYNENITFLRAVLFLPNFKVVNEMLNQMFVDDDEHPLHVSVLNKDLDGIKHLLKTCPNIVDSVDNGGRTALHLVAFKGDQLVNINIAQLLLDNKASVNIADSVLEWEPLQIADKAQAWAMVSLILQCGGNGNTMLSTRSSISNEDDFKELIECFPDSQTNSWKLMEIATRYGITSLLEYLVALGGDCSSLVDDGVSLMHLAAECGHVGVMTYLRDKGVLYTIPDTHNNVPMHSAVKGGAKDVLLFLMEESKECFSAQNDEGKTPAILATELFIHALDRVKNLTDTEYFKFDQSDRFCDVMECLLKQEGVWPEDNRAELERGVEEYKAKRASLQARGTYKKLRGSANSAGQSYEQKMSTLLFVRGIKSGRNFSLMGNMKAADKYDDVVFVDHDRRETYFIQLKHKKHNFGSGEPQHQGDGNPPFILTSDPLTGPDGDFSLLMYLDSYRKIKRDVMAGDADLNKCGHLKNMVFLLFTNATIDTKMVQLIETDDLFGTKGKYFHLKNENFISLKLKVLDDGISNLRDSLAQLSRHIEKDPSENDKDSVDKRVKKIKNTLKECLNHKQIKGMMNQLLDNPTKVEIDKALESDIFQLDRTSESRSEFLERFLLCTDQPHESQLDDIIKQEIHSFWPLDKPELSSVYTSLFDSVKYWSNNDNVVLTSMSRLWTEALHRTRRDKLASYGVTFTEEAVNSIVGKSMNARDAGVRLITVDQPALAIMKLLQQSEENLEACMQRPIFVKAEVLLRQKDSVLTAWKSVWCNTLVVECEKFVGMEQARTLVDALLKTADAENLDRTSPAGQDPSRTRKVLVVVSRTDHNVAKAVKQSTNIYVDVNSKFTWNDLTPESQNHLRTKSVCFQGIGKTMAELLQDKEALASKLDGDTVWQLITNVTLQLGKILEPPISQNLPRRLTTNQGVERSVRSLDDLPGKFALITGMPGMGKSTLFTELAYSTKQSDWLLWIIHINLDDCSTYLQNIQSGNALIDAIAFLQYFAGYGNTITSFEEELFYDSLYSKPSKIAVLFDGFDEILPDYKKEVMLIIKQLQTDNTLHKLCVSCRSAMNEELKSELGVEASNLVPFTKEEQLFYLATYWRDNNIDLDISFDNFKDIADKLLSVGDKSFPETLITGIPLMVKMIAVIYNKDVPDFHEDKKKFPETLYGVRLYDEFVERIFDIFLKEKLKVNLNTSAQRCKKKDDFKVFKRQHMHAALKYLEPREYNLITKLNRKAIEEGFSKFLESIKNGEERTGIIDGMTTSDQARFIHRTFLEYFLATWIYYNNKVENNTFLRAVLFQCGFKIVNEMLNEMLVDDSKHPLHARVLNGDLEGIKHLLKSTPDIVDSVDNGGRTALHLVTFVRDYLAKIEIAQLLLDNKASVNITDSVLEWEPLQIADKTQAWAMVSCILKRGGRGSTMVSTKKNISNEDDFQEFIECFPDPRTNSRKLMELATRYGMTSLLEYLVAQGGDCSSLGNDGVSLMHLAAECGHVDVMTYLRDKGVLYIIRDSHGNVPMHSAVKGGAKDVLVFLKGHDESKESFSAQNDKGQTPTRLATELFMQGRV